MMIVFCARPNGLQFILCLMSLVEALKLCVSCVSASSSDVLVIRHGRSRVRHSSEKSHIRWGLQAFDNLTLYDYDYEGANATNSNETLFGDFGGLNGGANQSFLGVDAFSYGDPSFSNGTIFINSNTNTNTSDTKWSSTSAPPTYSGGGGGVGGVGGRWSSISPLSMLAAKNPKLAKKQIMEGIRKNVEEGIEYLKRHAHLTQQSAIMPSEKALLQLQKQAEKLNVLTIRDKSDPVDPFSSATLSSSSSSSSSLSSSSSSSSKKHSKSSIGSALHKPIRIEYELNHDNNINDNNDNDNDNNNNNIKNQFDYNRFIDERAHELNEQLPFKAHQINETFGGASHRQVNEQRINDDHEMQNDEMPRPPPSPPTSLHNESAHHSSKHPYKSNKSHSRLIHTDGAKTASQSNGIATLKTIDSIVTSINAAVSKKNHDEAINGLRTSSMEKLNTSKPNLRSQSNGQAKVLQKETVAQPKNSIILHSIGTGVPKPNDTVSSPSSSLSSSSNVKFNKNSNNQFEANSFVSPFDELNDEQQASGDNGDESIPFPYETIDEQTTTFDGKSIGGVLGDTSPIFGWEDLDDLDEISRNNRLNLKKGRDVVTKFLQIVESQHLLGANCTAGTALNLGEGVVDRYAQVMLCHMISIVFFFRTSSPLLDLHS